MRKSSISDRYTGKDLEADLLGEGSPQARYEGKYKTYKEALTEVIQHPPAYRDRKGNEYVWDPENPPLYPTSFPNDLHFTVKEELEKAIDPDCELRLYNASGSTLDKMHGVDAFFEMISKGQRLYVTLDITNNPDKASHKADVVLQIPPEYVDSKDPELRETMLNEWTEQIVDAFKVKVSDASYARRSAV